MPSVESGSARFAALGRLVYRRRRRVLAAWLVGLAVLAPLAPRLQGALAAGGFNAQGSEAIRAGELLHRWIPGRPQAQLVVVSPQGRVAALRRALAPLARFPHVVLPPGGPAIVRSTRGPAAYAVFELAVNPDTARDFVDSFRRSIRAQPGLRLEVTGPPAVFRDIQTATAGDLRRAETVGIPAALLVLVLAFGTAVAAGVPLAVGGVAVACTLGLLYLVAQDVALSIFVLNIATMLGLGVGVDYALLAVSRFREQLAGGAAVADAVEVTVATAGRAIAFSGVAVLIGLSGLWVFGLRVLSSMAVGGSLVVAVSALGALTLLPAVLSMIGERVERWPVLPPRFRRADPQAFWARLAAVVMRRPWVFIVASLAVVAVLAAPALHARLNVPRADVLPPSFDSRRGQQVLDAQFDQSVLEPIVLAVPRGQDVGALIAEVRRVPGVAAVAGVQRGPGGTAVSVIGRPNPSSSAARDLVRRIRALPGHGSRFWVTGETAGELDFLDQILRRAPWAVALIFAATYVVLLAAFGSLLLPLKAILMNTLSIGGALGVLVWVFQDGNLGVQRPGYIESTMPVVIFCALFGVSMDYEVFMLSRIAEAYRAGADNREAVSRGLVATGRIITSAAAILVVIGLAFTTADVIIVKELGLGLAIAIGLDATLVRSLLVPATMRVLGDWNWWPRGRGP
jgi:uncharacterized membrane protein YdfJ with MMPL/SSD domain